MIFIEFLVKNFKPRYHGNGQQKVGFPIGFFSCLGQGEHTQKVLWKSVTRREQRFSMVTENWY